MATLDDFVVIALTQRGDPYVFGAEASIDDRNPSAFDCSELSQWAAGRLGIRFADGAQNQRDACKRAGTLINVDKGIKERGALLFRIDEGPGNDHVAISLGDGKTIEARGKAYGVNVFSATGRRWTHAGLIPGLDRGHGGTLVETPGLLQKGDRGEEVRRMQRRLQMHGFDPGPADGIFGSRTDAAVRAFQKAKRLEVDGIVGPKTSQALQANPS
jgi:cell wall-associated NlpC family hydrolase